MVSWVEFESAAPEIAVEGRRLLYARGDAEALLATVRGDGLPRIHPINVGIVDAGLYAFLLPSAKRADLEQDGRYALHTHQDPAAPDEFSVRGRARVIDDAGVRARVADAWPFEVDDTYLLVELSVEHAVLGLRGAEEWPPRYRRWSKTPGD
jgi:pyridoxamine 5'-phosphate oxidase-like protein